MNRVFLLTLIFAFLAIFVESVNLILQLKNRRLSRWFGKNAFRVHMLTTSALWIITVCLFAYLQLARQPLFHSSTILRFAGFSMVIAGLILGLWAFSLLGLKRALCLNFFEDGVPEVTDSLYKYIKNPLDYGMWMTLVGFAFFTRSTYNLIIAAEFIIIMIPHIILENKVLKRKRSEKIGANSK